MTKLKKNKLNHVHERDRTHQKKVGGIESCQTATAWSQLPLVSVEIASILTLRIFLEFLNALPASVTCLGALALLTTTRIYATTAPYLCWRQRGKFENPHTHHHTLRNPRCFPGQPLAIPSSQLRWGNLRAYKPLLHSWSGWKGRAGMGRVWMVKQYQGASLMRTLQIFVDDGYFGYLCRYPMGDEFLELRSLLLFDNWADALTNGCLILTDFINLNKNLD